MDLHLDEAEAVVLRDLLNRALGDLKGEIYKTEDADYKAALKDRESAFLRLLAQLGA